VAGLAAERAVDDLVSVGRAGPAGEVLSVEDGGEVVVCVLGEQGVGLGGVDLADEDVAPRDLAAVGLELDGAGAGNREVSVEVVFEARVVNDEDAVEPDADALPHHHDADEVPLAEGSVCVFERVFAGSAGAVVPEPAGAEVGADLPFAAGFGGVPDLDLGDAPEVDAAVGVGDGAVFEEELEVSEELVGSEEESVSVVDEHVVDVLPVCLDIGEAFLAAVGEGVFIEAVDGAGVLGAEPPPSGEAFVGDEPSEPLGGLLRRRRRGTEREHTEKTHQSPAKSHFRISLDLAGRADGCVRPDVHGTIVPEGRPAPAHCPLVIRFAGPYV